MFKTDFAGLTALDPGEPLSVDGYAFQTLNPIIIDRLLKLGARTHRHDAHASISNPTDVPTLTLTQNGNLPPNADIAIVYTLIDTDGGETLASPTALVTTAPPLDAPDVAPAADFDNVGGHIIAGTYTYAMTLTDPNGETTVGQPFLVNVDPGTDTNVITVSGLSDIVNSTPGATGWRMYKTSSVGQLHFLAAGGASLDNVVDDGLLCADCAVTPPTTNTTSVAQGIEVTVPNTVTNLATGVVAYRVYASVGGAFSSPSYVEQRADFGTPLDYTHIVVNPGAPPDVSTSYGGAQKIDPDTELLDWHWKRPVATAADLPHPADTGDVRAVTSDGTIWTFNGNDWVEFTAPAVNWKPAVATATDLPPVGDPANVVGDVRLALDSRFLYLFLADGWVNVTAPPHTIRSAVATMPQRRGLQFLGCDVTDDAVNDTTIIQPQATGGGGGGDGGSSGPPKLQMGESVEWVDAAGVTQVSLTAERTAVDETWFYETFTDPALADWLGVTTKFSSGSGTLAPTPTHPLNADIIIRHVGAESLDQEISGGKWNLHLLNFNAIGYGIAWGVNNDAGIFAKLVPDGGAFKLQVVSRASNADAWVVEHEYPIAAGKIVADDGLSFQFRRDGGKLIVGLWNITQSGEQLVYDESLDVPASVAALNGSPALLSNITDPASWTLEHSDGIRLSPVYTLRAKAGTDNLVLADTSGHHDWQQLGTPGDGWHWGGYMRLALDGYSIELRGQISKDSGTNPMPGEVMFTIDNSTGVWNWPSTTTMAVATGDRDGDEVGIVKFESGSWALIWAAGRSSDPATKSPFMNLDGCSIPK